MCVHLRSVLKLLMGDVKHCVDFSELFLLFLLLHTFFSVAWMRVCATLKFPLGEMEGKKKPSQILTGALGKAHCLSYDAESFLCIYYKQRNAALGTELCLKILQRCLWSYRVENSREQTCSRSRDFLSKIEICIQNVKNNERKPKGQLK